MATMDDESLVDQMCLATAARKQRRHRHWLGLPTLNTGRHVFLRARNRHYDIETVFLAFQASRERLGTKGRLRREVRRLYDQKMPQWQRELEQNRSACERGKKYLLLVQREYERRGLVAVAKTLSLSDLRVNSEGACVLYLNVAEEKAGLFCGPKHRTRLEVGESVSALLADEGEGVSLEIQLESQYRRPRGRLRAR